jgi:hypothetical protein
MASLGVALDLAKRGLPVFPCGPDKRPLTPHGFKDASSDARQIEAWWRAYPEALVGLPTGSRSGLYVVDLDIDRATGEALGEDSLARLGLAWLLAGPRVRTPSGGTHLYFRWPGEGFGNTAGKIGAKIDTRGEGGYVIAAGSAGPAGAYQAEGAWWDPPELPATLRARLQGGAPGAGHSFDTGEPRGDASAWGEAALQGEIAKLRATREGGRNDALNHAAFRLGQIVAGGGLDRAQVEASLLTAAVAVGLPEAEARKTIASGFGAGGQSPRRPDPQGSGRQTAFPVEPQPLLRPVAPGKAYPVQALGALRTAVEAVQGMTQAPVAIPAASALAVASVAVQGFADVDTLGGSRPLSLYLLTIAQSGERKSSCDAPLMAALRDFERDEARAHRTDLASWQNAQALWKGERDRILSEARKGKGERRTAAEVDLNALGPEPAAPPSTDRTVTEPTFEGQTRLFAMGQPSLGIFSDEGGQFLGGFAMNADNRTKTLAALNDLWQGNPIRRTRAGDGALTLFGRRLAMHLMVQPGVARDFMSDPKAADTGFLPRFLICEPPSHIGTRMQANQRRDDASLAAFGKRLRAVLEAPMPMDPDTRELKPRLLPLAPEARALLVCFADAVEGQQAPGGTFEHVTGHASKAAEQAARIAGVLTVWQDLDAREVTGATMADAITLAGFYLSEAARLADVATVAVEVDLAEKLRVWLVDRWDKPEILTSEVLQRAPVRALRDRSAARKALAMLADAGWLVPLEPGTVVRGRPRREPWRIVKGAP